MDFWGFRPSGCHTAQSNAACRVGGAAGTRFVRRLEVFTLTSTILTLPEHLRLSLTWDQGKEMSQHRQFTIVTGVLVYFCDPHSPWQRGSNENTNGLLRQYFPKSTNLAAYTPQDLLGAAAQLNSRPRKTLNWDTPAERLNQLLQSSH